MLDEYGVSLLGRGGRAMLSNTASTTNDDPHWPWGHHAPIPFLDVNCPSLSYDDGNSYSNSDMPTASHAECRDRRNWSFGNDSITNIPEKHFRGCLSIVLTPFLILILWQSPFKFGDTAKYAETRKNLSVTTFYIQGTLFNYLTYNFNYPTPNFILFKV